jgi:hypothetical protein
MDCTLPSHRPTATARWCGTREVSPKTGVPASLTGLHCSILTLSLASYCRIATSLGMWFTMRTCGGDNIRVGRADSHLAMHDVHTV